MPLPASVGQASQEKRGLPQEFNLHGSLIGSNLREPSIEELEA